MFNNKLTTSMQTATGWKDLAGVVSSLNEEATEVILNRAAGLQSIFQMSNQDLDIRLNELGQYFRFGEFGDESKAMVVQQRLDELHLKDTLYPLRKTLSREVNGVAITWESLYNHKDFAYTRRMRVADQLGDKSSYWRTNRGVLRVNVNDLLGMPKNDFDEAVDKLESTVTSMALPLIPLDLVFDGLLYLILIKGMERPERARIVNISIDATASSRELFKQYRHDAYPIDEFRIDAGSLPWFEETADVSDIESLAWPSSNPLSIESYNRLDELSIDSSYFDNYVEKRVVETARVIMLKEIE